MLDLDASSTAMTEYQEKTVLLSYLEYKKIVSIPDPDSAPSQLKYLREVVITSYKLESNVSVAFQKFDEEWKEFIDIEDIAHKDKIRAIVAALPRKTDQASEVEVCEKNTFLYVQVETTLILLVQQKRTLVLHLLYFFVST